MFRKAEGDGKKKWKAEYEDTIYKIYDWDSNLAAYFFPQYEAGGQEINEEDDNAIEKLNKSHRAVMQSVLLLPMVKLDLLDREDGIDLDYVIGSLDANLGRAKRWNDWLRENTKKFGIVGNIVYTAREDRDMLSIGLRLNSSVILGEKEVIATLAPLLDKLHQDGLL